MLRGKCLCLDYNQPLSSYVVVYAYIYLQAELEQKAEAIILGSIDQPATKPRKDLFELAAEVYATFTTHRVDLARCLLGAERFKDAGDTYLQLQNFANAAKCFEKGKLWLQAAHAYNSYDELEHALRCAYECHDYDTAAAFITQYKARNPAASELIRHQTAYSRKGADYYLSKKDLKTMMQFVHSFPTTVCLYTMILDVTCMYTI